MSPIGVMQLTDTLRLGGMEVMAVNLANSLASRGLRSHLCSSRASGPLRLRLSAGVCHLDLKRRGLMDLRAIRRLARFIRQHRIDILHAHGTSVFLTCAAGLMCPGVRIIYHAHFGCLATEARFVWAYRLAARRLSGIIAVNEPLLVWARERVGFPPGRSWQVPNFVTEPVLAEDVITLPGRGGKRVVCVANLRPEKDHLTLVEALDQVLAVEPDAMLLLIGSQTDRRLLNRLRRRIGEGALCRRVAFLGTRPDVPSVLSQCDVGVLSSISEGMPLAILEYGLAGLPVVATAVGQVPEVLGMGTAGLLVPPRQPEALAGSLVRLLRSVELRRTLGAALQARVRAGYGESVAVNRILAIYDAVRVGVL